jgi:DNA invertase Pin-like site-specific DNA recombinase
MLTALAIPAAQYLRMSTDRQEYSLENQKTAIEEYAALHGFRIVKTYADPGKSGVVLRHRLGLLQLLSDVTSTGCPFKAVLVYDISRWGRFQDNDESAHYEFLCKNSGVPVHYCAEPFSNDCTVPSLIMKALKRTMAGEFSRELGQRVFQAQKRMVLLGYRMGSRVGYGLRRKMVSVDSRRNRILKNGEYKGIHSDHIVVVPGPAKEIKVVREIYSMYLRSRGRVGTKLIARELNARGIEWINGKRWCEQTVRQVLTNPKYIGTNVWGRTAQRLDARQKFLARTEWIEKRGAFQPIIDAATFDRVQRLRQKRQEGPSDEELLHVLELVAARKGKLTRRIIDDSVVASSCSLYRKRFDNLQRVYDLVGATYDPQIFVRRQKGIQAEHLRDAVVKEILSTFPKHVAGFRTNSRRQRPILVVDDEFTISVVVARAYETPFGKKGWTIKPVPYEYGQLTLLCQINEARDRVLGLYVMPPLTRPQTQHKFDTTDPWFRKGKPITVDEFYQAAMAAHATRIANGDDGSIRRRELLHLRHPYACH